MELTAADFERIPRENLRVPQVEFIAVDLMTCDPTDGDCVMVAENVGKFGDIILAGETYGGL